jgi:outer membrane protein OmpA-like peptidoglycan-associated protein
MATIDVNLKKAFLTLLHAGTLVFLVGCSSMQMESGTEPSRTSIDGSRFDSKRAQISGVLVAKPFEFEGRTVLEFSSEPGVVVVRDSSGRVLETQRSGRFVKLMSVVERFTVSVGGREMFVVMSPELATNTEPKSELQAKLLQLQHEVALLRRELAAKRSENVSAGSDPAVALTEDSRSTPREAEEMAARKFTIHGLASGISKLQPDAQTRAQLARAGVNALRVEVQAFTSSGKDSPAMQRLARSRAVEAEGLLVALGIARSKINLRHSSSRQFAVGNHTPEGRARNRRVEFVFQYAATVPAVQSEIPTATTHVLPTSAMCSDADHNTDVTIQAIAFTVHQCPRAPSNNGHLQFTMNQ